MKLVRYDLLAEGACNKPFSKTLTPTEYAEGSVVCPPRGSEEGEHGCRRSTPLRRKTALAAEEPSL